MASATDSACRRYSVASRPGDWSGNGRRTDNHNAQHDRKTRAPSRTGGGIPDSWSTAL